MRDFTEELLGRMDDRDMQRVTLANAAGVSQAYISKVLSGSENFTIETMTKLALAVGGKVRLHIADLSADTRWVDSLTAGVVTNAPTPQGRRGDVSIRPLSDLTSAAVRELRAAM
jgi:transcriptional regulator with XRE-family HTH domain